MSRSHPVPLRVPFLLAAGFSLLAGLDAALILLGLSAPVSSARLPEVHGMVMVAGFVGTLIALERAVALRRLWGYVAPGLLGLGALLALSPAPLRAGQLVLLLGAGALVLLYVPLWQRQFDDAIVVQALGATLLTGAIALWLGGVDVPHLLPWLIGFVVLTIGGERLELARIAMGENAGSRLSLLCALVAVAVAASALHAAAYPVLGLAMLALIGWLARHDVAWRTVRSTGVAQYAAGCMLTGYGWLGVTGGIWAIRGAQLDGPGYDAVIHSAFLGFTISMIMAHAPIILPAVLRRPLRYSPVLIGPAVLLHLSLVLRLWVGDGFDQRWAWRAGGVLNIVALLGFLALAAWLTATSSAPSGQTGTAEPSAPTIAVPQPSISEAAR